MKAITIIEAVLAAGLICAVVMSLRGGGGDNTMGTFKALLRDVYVNGSTLIWR